MRGFCNGLYNVVCLPLFAIIAMILAVGPLFGWKDGFGRPALALASGIIFVSILALGIMQSIKPFMAVVGVAAAAATITTVVSMGVMAGKKAWSKAFLAAHGTHVAFALIVLGVAVSGPFQKTWERAMNVNESFQADGYTFTYTKLTQIKGDDLTINEAAIEVSRDNKFVGTLRPQQRIYRNYDHPNSEVSTLFSLGTELYATIHDLEGDKLQPLRVSIHPLVNWLWIGSILICLFPLLAWRTAKSRKGELHAK